MEEIIVPAILGVMIVIFGILNLRGNFSLLHKYHYKRVAEADKKPFGLLVGIGTILIGIGMLLCSLFAFLAKQLSNSVFITVGYTLLVAGFVVGLILSFYAMIKYNRGIF